MLSDIDTFVRDIFSNNSKGAHTYDHIRRVYYLAIEIGKELGADLKILSAAALLHDIGRVHERERGISHSILSGEMGEGLLRELGYSENEIGQIKSAIRSHRFSEGIQPTTLEGMILSDADKLDAIGAIGVFRAIAQAESTGVGIQGFLRHADEKLLRLRDLMYTEPARRMASKRHNVLQSFVDELRADLAGFSDSTSLKI